MLEAKIPSLRLFCFLYISYAWCNQTSCIQYPMVTYTITVLCIMWPDVFSTDSPGCPLANNHWGNRKKIMLLYSVPDASEPHFVKFFNQIFH